MSFFSVFTVTVFLSLKLKKPVPIAVLTVKKLLWPTKLSRYRSKSFSNESSMAVVSPFMNKLSSFHPFWEKTGCIATVKTRRTSNFFIRLLNIRTAAHRVHSAQNNEDEIKKIVAGLIITNFLLTYITLTITIITL